MQAIKRLVSKISKESIFQQIIQSKSPSEQQFSQAVQQFSHLSHEQKQSTFAQIFATFRRPRSTRAILSALLLADYLHSLQPQISLFHNCSEPQLCKQSSVGKKHLMINEKIFVAEEQFISFYFKFLKHMVKKTQHEIDFFKCTMEQWIQYCQVSIQQILEFTKIDFIVTFLLKNSFNPSLFKMALQSIFQKMSFDIRIINRFVQKHLRLVTQKHQHCFKINEIYQKTLHINTHLQKFRVITKQLTKKIIFQEYEVDKELNKSIQMEMYERDGQKKEFMISSRKKLEENNENGTLDSNQNTGLGNVQGDTMIRLNQFI